MLKHTKQLIVGALSLAIILSSCSDNTRAKVYGGTKTIDLPKGQRFIDMQWKGESIWYLTRPLEPNEKPRSYRFQESSKAGIIEGTIIVNESN